MAHLGKYRLVRRLAAGGMAELYLARQSGPGGFEKTVAVKKLLPDLSEQQETIQMFLNEARIAARLTHPNIAQIYDLGEVDGGYFIAMEFVYGRDLRQVQNEAEDADLPMPFGVVAHVIACVCRGLHLAHTATNERGVPLGLVHRDVSPQNVLLAFTGDVKIVDFGIAKATKLAAVTQAGLLKGKFAYMSPEQCRGDELDARSDIFSTGVLLYELACRRRLFRRPNEFATMRAVLEEPIPPPSAVSDEVPDELEEIIMRALARDRDQRYETAQEMQLELEEAIRSAAWPSSPLVASQYMATLFPDAKPPGQDQDEETDAPLLAAADEPTRGTPSSQRRPRPTSPTAVVKGHPILPAKAPAPPQPPQPPRPSQPSRPSQPAQPAQQQVAPRAVVPNRVVQPVDTPAILEVETDQTAPDENPPTASAAPAASTSDEPAAASAAPRSAAAPAGLPSFDFSDEAPQTVVDPSLAAAISAAARKETGPLGARPVATPAPLAALQTAEGESSSREGLETALPETVMESIDIDAPTRPRISRSAAPQAEPPSVPPPPPPTPRDSDGSAADAREGVPVPIAAIDSDAAATGNAGPERGIRTLEVQRPLAAQYTVGPALRSRLFWPLVALGVAILVTGLIIALAFWQSSRANQEPGTKLEIISRPPGATVYVDGHKRLGQTPLTLSDLAPGPHRIVLMLARHKNYETKIDLARGKANTIDARLDLTPTGGLARVVVQAPPHARIFLDGELRGRGTTMLDRIVTGVEHSLVVKGADKLDETVLIPPLQPGELRTITVVLQHRAGGGGRNAASPRRVAQRPPGKDGIVVPRSRGKVIGGKQGERLPPR